MTDPTPKSRLPRRRVILLAGAVSVVVGVALLYWWPYHREQAAIVEIEKAGGFTRSGVVRPYWVPDSVADERLKLFTKVDAVNLSGPQVGDAELEYLQNLDNVQILNLHRTRVTDAGLGRLRLPKLWDLSLEGTPIGDAGLKQIRNRSHLEWLNLANTRVSDAGLEHLAGLPKLQVLSLNNTDVSDAGMVHVGGLSDLIVLWLQNTQVSDAGVKHLCGLKKLRFLYLDGSRVTPAGYFELRFALRDCEIHWSPPREKRRATNVDR